MLVILDKTPFYAESGGQIGDKGLLQSDEVMMEIEDVNKLHGNHIVHKGKSFPAVSILTKDRCESSNRGENFNCP